MNISYKWLKEYVDTTLSAQEVADDIEHIGREDTGTRYDQSNAAHNTVNEHCGGKKRDEGEIIATYLFRQKEEERKSKEDERPYIPQG